ncbi:cellulose biosynthesis protein BcsQ [Paenibacillus sp. PastF-3]|nr:cellulose biosynthesis protein BcsQ [Paenibacillus sp. PastF-3]
MEILLVTHKLQKIVEKYCTRAIDVVNDSELVLSSTLEFLQNIKPSVDSIFITDDALSTSMEQIRSDLNNLIRWLIANQQSNVKILILTRDIRKDIEMENLISRYPNLQIKTFEYIRITPGLFREALEQLSDTKQKFKHETKPHENKNHSKNIDKKGSFLDRFKPKPKAPPELQATDSLTRELDKVSRGISRIVAITGHSGCGITSTTINVASEASKRGLSVLIVDLDIEYRSTNMYFSSFHERTKRDEDINASLIRTLARPQDYLTTAYHLKENMWLTGLGYSFSDRKLMEQFYTSSKLVGLLSLLRNKFNLILLDLPMNSLDQFREALIHIDSFGLCIPNNLYAVLSTLKNVEESLDKENAAYLNAKSKVIVTKYNDRSRFQGDIFTPDRVSAVTASGLLESFTYEMKVAGHVSYDTDFDSQIETDVPLVHSNKDHERAYGNILLRLLEGSS